jgi:hypothetical protein
MRANVGLYNQDTSMNTDTFEIQDMNAGGAIIARPSIKGGDTFRFNCASDGQGYGELNIRNVQSTWVHFDFVRDIAVLNM